MKRNLIFVPLVCFLVLGGMSGKVISQQIPISHLYVYQPQLFNPAARGTDGLNRAWLSHQHRRMSHETLSNHQTLVYSGHAFGNHNKMGWGLQLVNDFEHTDHRTHFNFSMAYHLINSFEIDDHAPESLGEGLRVSIGGMGGILNLTEDYSKVPVSDRNDPTLTNQSISRMDLGVGVDAYYRKGILKAEFGGTANQLPEWMLGGERADTLVSIPHILAHGGAMVWVSENLWIGPQVMYKEEFGTPRQLGAAQLDLNLKLETQHPKMWMGGGYRLGNAAVNGGFGIRIIDQDSTRKGRFFPQKWDLNAVFEYPLNNSRIFGPSFEIGLQYAFGKIRQVEYDTVNIYRGPFWVTTGNLGSFKDHQLNGRTQPEKLYIRSDNANRKVTLSYQFPDNIYQFHTIDQVGVEPILKHIANDVLRIPFLPEDERDYGYHEHLAQLESIEIQCWLKYDQIAAKFLADSIQYREDSILQEAVIYDEKDSVFQVAPGRITNLELAFLKLVKIREFFLRAAHDELGRIPQNEGVEIKPLKIISNNPNLESWQKNEIILTFRKGRGKMKPPPTPKKGDAP